MKQLIYRSQPFGFDRAILAGILTNARRNNLRDDISGALICRQDLYLQLIEGSAEKIDALYARILDDDRHCDVQLLLADEVDERIFPEWAMLDDTAPSMVWSPQDIGEGAIDDTTPAMLRVLFEHIARKERSALPTPATDTV